MSITKDASVNNALQDAGIVAQEVSLSMSRSDLRHREKGGNLRAASHHSFRDRSKLASSPKMATRSLTRYSSWNKSQEFRPPRHPGLRQMIAYSEKTVPAPSVRNYRTQVIMFQ